MGRTLTWTSALLAATLVAYKPGTASADVHHRRSPIVEVVEKVSPAVVYIGTEQVIEERARGDARDFFDDFFGPRERRQAVQGLGSGVIIDPSGLIVTNDHVIHGASTIHVGLGQRKDAQRRRHRLRCRQRFGRAQGASAGGAPGGREAGHLQRPDDRRNGGRHRKPVRALQDGDLGRGFRDRPQLQGQRTHVQRLHPDGRGDQSRQLRRAAAQRRRRDRRHQHGDLRQRQGIGFAIPADKVKRIVTELTQFRKVRPVWVGIDVQSLTPEQAGRLGWDRNNGVVVTAIDSGSPAERAGLQQGDIIAEVASTPVDDQEDFDVRLRSYPAGAQIPMSIYRDGRVSSLAIVAQEFPVTMADQLSWDRLGLRIRPTGGGMGVAAVRPGSAAIRIGIAPGDVILQVNNTPTRTLDAYREALIAARLKRSVLILLRRGAAAYHITLPF